MNMVSSKSHRFNGIKLWRLRNSVAVLGAIKMPKLSAVQLRNVKHIVVTAIALGGLSRLNISVLTKNKRLTTAFTRMPPKSVGTGDAQALARQ